MSQLRLNRKRVAAMLAAKDHDLPLFSLKMPMAMAKAVDMMNSTNY
jgi:hypothetical protein